MRAKIICLVSILLAFLVSCSVKQPGWVEGKNEQYPTDAYFTGVGFDKDRATAENRARAEIAKNFQVRIHSTQTSSEQFWLSHTAPGVESKEYSQRAQTELTASTDKILSGVQVAEIWRNDKTGEYYALAVLDRLRTARTLRRELNELDQSVPEYVRLAEEAKTPVRQLGYYMQALKLLEKRQSIAADLGIVDPTGWVAESSTSSGEIAARADRAAARIRLGIVLEGDDGAIVKGALIHALAGIGIKLAPAEQDLVMKGTVTVEEYQAGQPWLWSVAAAQVEFVEKEGAVIDSLRTTVREGSRIKSRSRTRALERLGEKLADLLLSRIGKLGLAGK